LTEFLTMISFVIIIKVIEVQYSNGSFPSLIH